MILFFFLVYLEKRASPIFFEIAVFIITIFIIIHFFLLIQFSCCGVTDCSVAEHLENHVTAVGEETVKKLIVPLVPLIR